MLSMQTYFIKIKINTNTVQASITHDSNLIKKKKNLVNLLFIDLSSNELFSELRKSQKRNRTFRKEFQFFLTMMIRWASRVRARKYTTRSLLGSLRFLKAGVCRVIVCGDGRGGGGTSRGRKGPGFGGGRPASAGRRRFRSASWGERRVQEVVYQIVYKDWLSSSVVWLS